MSKLRVALHEFNIVVGAFRYLPYSTGLVRAYAETDPLVKDAYEFLPFQYEMLPTDEVLKRHPKTFHVAAFSVAMWNEQLCLAVAERLRDTYGDSLLIIFGGCHVPHHPEAYMAAHPFIDVCVRGDGEESFRTVLRRYAEKPGTRNFEGIPGISFRILDSVFEEKEGWPFDKDLDKYPSPYQLGLFDELMDRQTKDHRFQCILETNRGCPFDCSFCIAAGTEITTITGKRRIEELKADDFVLSWDEELQAPTYSRIGAALSVGLKPTVAIKAGGKYVQATNDHAFYTRRGWKSASELRAGDQVLLNVWEARGRREEVLFGGMLVPFGGETAVDDKKAQGRGVHKSQGRGLPFYAGEQSYEAAGSRCEAVGDSEAKDSKRGASSLDEYGSRPQSDRGVGKEASVRTGQPYEAAGSVSEGASFSEGASEWVGEKGDRILGGIQPPVSICRGRELLDRTVRFGEVQESGLHSPKEGGQEGDSCPRKVLAPFQEGERAGVGGLPKSWLEVPNRMGRRTVRCQIGATDSPFRWATIDSVQDGGTAEVYDLANLSPCPNFFANDFLAHNCYWAQGGLSLKYKFHSLDYVKSDIEWTGKHQIPYIFLSDSNFAMHRRDKEIAEYAVETKRRFSFPEKLRVCWGKNTDEKIFEVAGILHGADMEKGITLARQSNDLVTLKNIRRDNIKLETYRNLQGRFTEKGVPVYMELILGLPGETLQSWKKGINDCLISAGSRASLFVYLSQVLPNTEQADPEYQKKHGIRTRRIELQEIHSSPRGEGWVKEYEDIVIATDSLPYNDWREACKFSWATMLLHSMKAGFFVLAWLWYQFKVPPSKLIEHFTDRPEWDRLLDEMSVFGNGRGQVLSEYGDIYWDVEEAALLRLLEDSSEFYERLKAAVYRLVPQEANRHEIDAVLQYQQRRTPAYGRKTEFRTDSYYNIAEYFDKLFTANPVPLEKKPQHLTFRPKTFSSREEFARQTILWGRKSGTMLVPCEYEDIK